MSTVFIAVQCCQCSTMQVKQKKKSSNKWTCVVCNQKQSIIKVFAQGFMAKDIRKFVQSFNMSRQFAEQQEGSIVEEETLAPLPEDSNNQPAIDHRKRRTDWSEYIDPEEDEEENNHDDKKIKPEQEEDMFETMIVTELPSKALFKKPKLDRNSSGLLDITQDGKKSYRPVFSNRNSNKPMISQDTEPRKNQLASGKQAFNWNECTAQDRDYVSAYMEPIKHLPTTTKGASKWRTYVTEGKEEDVTLSRQCYPTLADGTSKQNNYKIQEKNEDLADKVPWRCPPRTMKGASKWDNYLTEEDDELKLQNGREFADHIGQWDDGVFEATLYGEMVEEDIHPDFQ